MKKLLLLATSITAYYLLKNKQKKQAQAKKEDTPIKTVNPQQKPQQQQANPKKQTASLDNDEFLLTGEYRWTFYLGPIKQVSTHIFAKDYIDYRMDGKAHSTTYRMKKLSYNAEQGKWIGITDDDVVYVMFFKPSVNLSANNDKITLYKHKCANGDKGIAEATAFAYPADDATADHGWNIYSKQGTDEPEDVLPFSGEFVATDDKADNKIDNKASDNKVTIADGQVTWAGKSYQKLTHHTGERRWVGQCEEQYLVMFYELNQENTEVKSISLSLQTYDDGEVAYQSKHDQQAFMDFKIIN